MPIHIKLDHALVVKKDKVMLTGDPPNSPILTDQHLFWMRRRLSIPWQLPAGTDEKSRGVQDLSEMVRNSRLRLAGHVPRLPQQRSASVAMNWLYETGPAQNWYNAERSKASSQWSTWTEESHHPMSSSRQQELRSIQFLFAFVPNCEMISLCLSHLGL